MGKYDNIKVSVIVPVYRCEKYIGDCVRSILAQTHENLEIILVLDGAADDSPAICKALANSDSRVLVIEQENQGVSVARNNGIEAAIGEWIMFVDGDDWLDKNCIEVLLRNAEVSECDVVVSPVLRDDGSVPTRASFFSPNRSIVGGAEKEALFINTIISKDQSSGWGPEMAGPCAKLFRHELLSEYNIRFVQGMKIAEDVIFVDYVFLHSTKTTLIGDGLYHYRTNPESAMHAYNADYQGCIMIFLEEIEKIIQLTGMNVLREAVREQTVILLLDMIRLQFVPAQCPLSRTDKVRQIESIIEDERAPFRENILRSGLRYLSFKHNIARLLLKYRCYSLVYLLCEFRAK